MDGNINGDMIPNRRLGITQLSNVPASRLENWKVCLEFDLWLSGVSVIGSRHLKSSRQECSSVAIRHACISEENRLRTSALQVADEGQGHDKEWTHASLETASYTTQSPTASSKLVSIYEGRKLSSPELAVLGSSVKVTGNVLNDRSSIPCMSTHSSLALKPTQLIQWIPRFLSLGHELQQYEDSIHLYLEYQLRMCVVVTSIPLHVFKQ